MKTIQSRDNALFKSLKQLAGSNAARKQAGKALLDGVHLCEVYLARIGTPSQALIAASALEHAEVAGIVAALPDAQCIVLDDALFQAISQLDQGIGIAFLIDVPNAVSRPAIKTSCVLLDRLQDPGNLGSILRSAAAAGITQVYCSSGCASAWSPKVLRAGMGAHFYLEVFEDCDLQVLIEQAQVLVLATSSHARFSIYQCDLSQPVAWLFGNEGSGVAPSLQTQVEWVSIPQPGIIESLNVGAAAAICLFEQVRRQL